nr:hypothetical protein [Candidatus Njordarchaeum guaymaensis]
MGALHQTGKLHCPYAMCNKTFEKPIVLTDTTKLIRETYYACPHCRSKIEIVVEDPNNPKLVQVEDVFNISQKAPAQCKHGLGFLGDFPDNADIPDECAICPKVMQCFIKRQIH